MRKPEELLEELRLAIASGAIQLDLRQHGYPEDLRYMGMEDTSLHIDWVGASITLTPHSSSSS